MPFYYDLARSETSNSSANSTSTHFAMKTATSQETLALKGIYLASRFATAGGAQFRVMSNSGTVYSGGTAQTPQPRNLRSPAAGVTAVNDNASITAGATLTQRLSVGFAQTGGMGGWVPIEAPDAIQMMAGGTNPVDLEFVSDAATASVTFDATIEFSEGI